MYCLLSIFAYRRCLLWNIISPPSNSVFYQLTLQSLIKEIKDRCSLPPTQLSGGYAFH